jgi:nucleoside-diphosphate-sugar epimerase
MAIQFTVGFDERNLKLGSASHRHEQSEEGAPPIDYGAGRPGDVKHSIASIDKMHTAGFRPVCDFAGGLRATIEFFKHIVGIQRNSEL